MKKILIAAGIVIVLVFVAGLFNQDKVFGQEGFLARKCTISDTTPVSVTMYGTGTTTVLSAYSNRAWARITLGDGQNDKVWLGMDEAASSTASTMYLASTTGRTLDVGLNQDIPFVGTVYGLASATTTVYVTDCRY